MKTLRILLMSALLITAFLPPFICGKSGSEKHRVLVLHSFHKGQKWNDDLSKGIESILKTGMIELNFEFMDTIRSLDDHHIKNLVRLYQHKYSTRKVDLVISTDEQALDFLLNHRSHLLPDASIVYCGIKSYKERFGVEGLTGVIESVDIRSNVELAMEFNPGLKEIFVVSDNTPTSISLINPLIQMMKEFSSEIDFRFTEFVPIKDLKLTLRNLAPDTAVLLINYTKDKNGQIFSMDESAGLITSHSPVPVYTLWDSYMGMGILGGKLVSGYTQGQAAAKMALRILGGESPSKIPVQTSLPSQYFFDYQKLRKYDIRDSKLPANSHIYNLPRTFYRQYKRLIIAVIIGGFFLSLIILVLSINIMSRRRVEKALKTYSDRLNYLHRLDQFILNDFSLEGMSDSIMGPTLRLYDCQLFGIYLFGTETVPAAGVVQFYQDDRKIIENLTLHKNDLPMDRLQRGEVVNLHAGQSEVDFIFNKDSFTDFDNYQLIPLMFQNQLLGILFVGNADGKEFDYDTETTLKQAADSLAIAVQNDHFLMKIKGHEAELRHMSLNILKAQEKERKLLSAELHDEFGQTLTAIGLNLSVMRRKLDKSQPEKIRPRLEEVEQSIELLSKQIHNLSLDLRPPILDDLGLIPSLRWYLNQYEDRSGLSIDFSVNAETEQLVPKPVSVTMYRVLQEALNNITKHAKATKVAVQISVTSSHVRLQVSDNGVGFDYNRVMSQNPSMQALGLIGMRERLELLDGSLAIKTAENCGTTLLAVSSIDKKDHYGSY